MRGITALLVICSLATANMSIAHSGGTDANGCHAGSQPYHCHGGSSSGGEDVDIDGTTILIIVGSIVGAVGLGALIWWLATPSKSTTQLTPSTDSGLADIPGMPSVDIGVGEDQGALNLTWRW